METVREGLARYLAENGFTVEQYDAPTATVAPFGFKFQIPNPKARKHAVRRHDLHHLATGYATDLVGETEISCWELSRGLRGLGLYVRFIVVSVALLGFVAWPRRAWRAFRAAPNGGTLFDAEDIDGLMPLSVEQLRERLKLPPHGLAHSSARNAVSSPAV